jgi:hypothetical protein
MPWIATLVTHARPNAAQDDFAHLLSRFHFWDGSMKQSIPGRKILVLVALVATISLIGQASFSATPQCTTAPGPPAPHGMHWYYRVDRTTNRHCWYMQSASLQVRMRPHVTNSNPQPQNVAKLTSAPLPTDSISLSIDHDADESWQFATAEIVPTATSLLSSPQSGPAAIDFARRWFDLPKSIDLKQREFATSPNNYALEASADFKEPTLPISFVALDPKHGLPHQAARTVNLLSIFLAGALTVVLFGGVLKLWRWLYCSATWVELSWRERADGPEISLSELMRTLQRIDEAFGSQQAFSTAGRLSAPGLPADQRVLQRDYAARRTRLIDRATELACIENAT